MARRFRFETLSPEQKFNVNSIVQNYFPAKFHQRIIDSIEKNGKISNQILSEVGFNQQDMTQVQSLLQPAFSGIYNPKDAYQKFIGTGVDESNLSDTEIQDRLRLIKGFPLR